MAAPEGAEPTLGELVATATRDLSLLVHQEVELAKTELKTSAKNAGLGAGFLGVAGFLGLAAFFTFTIFFGEVLVNAGLKRWAAYLIVTAVYGLLAGVLALWGAKRLKKLSAPERTMQTVKDDVAWLKHPTTAPTTKVASR